MVRQTGIIPRLDSASEASPILQSRSYIFLAIVLILGVLSGWGYTQREYSYGLDVDGGVRLIYRLDMTKLGEGKTKEQALSDTLAIMERRATNVNAVRESSIRAKGTDQVIIELPGQVSLEEARKTMDTSAKIEWYWARNLATEKASFRTFREAAADRDPKDPNVSFYRTAAPEKVISYWLDKEKKVVNPEYQQIIKGWTLILEGDELEKAYAQNNNGKWQPAFRFSPIGGRKMRAWCVAHPNQGENLAAVLDGQVISIAPLMDGAVIEREGFISGDFTSEYVKNLTALLNSGALPVPIINEGAVSVDPTIGKFALGQIVKTGLISFGIIVLFLLAYYSFPGLVALVALLLYILFSLSVMKFLGATFSLAAIAGFILSVGMAVDANILVFERVKEELRAGKKLQTAIDLGFKRAFPAILDSNACTIITSAVLFKFGTGPVQGFASILIIGVAISLFTAVFVTRSLLMFLVGSGIGANEKLYGLNRQWFGEGLEQQANIKPMRVLEKSKLYFTISILTIVPGIIALAMGGLKPNVEFTGGIEAAYTVDSNVTSKSIQEKLEAAGYPGANVQFATAGTEKQVLITVAETKDVTAKDPIGSSKKIAEIAGLDATKSKGVNAVGSAIRDETIKNAVMGVLVSAAFIILYLSMRFGFALGGFVIGLRFAFTVILALIHDVFIVLGIAAIMGYLAGWQISALFISAMLTVIGFSTHDTIVIFDRIRENLRKPLPDESIDFLINRSITQSLARSINTSATVIVTLILLVVMGSATNELRHFNLAMLVGIVSGTYSSIFNAAPILYYWDRWVGKRKGEENTMLGMAKASASKVRLTRQSAPAPAPGPGAPVDTASQTYGQVKRRQRANQFDAKPLDDEEV